MPVGGAAGEGLRLRRLLPVPCEQWRGANENALKLASFYNGRTRGVSFSGAFHGRTSLAVEVTGNPSIVTPANDCGHVTRLPLNDIEAMRARQGIAAEATGGTACVYWSFWYPCTPIVASPLSPHGRGALVFGTLSEGASRFGKRSRGQKKRPERIIPFPFGRFILKNYLPLPVDKSFNKQKT